MKRWLLPILLSVTVTSGAGEICAGQDQGGNILLTNIPGSALACMAMAGPGGSAEPFPGKREAYREHVAQAARELRLDEALIEAVIAVESAFSPSAVSPKGAVGLMQLMPQTARRFGALDAFDPAQNIRAGARYLRYLLDLFGGDLELALAAYNAGEGAVRRNGARVPPFRETVEYVRKVRARYRPAQRD
jgi:soluble lytic murein transglycosylase-like protein